MATRVRSSGMLSGFICLEEVRQSSASPWPRRRSVLGALARPAWVYAVFQQGRLRCYGRRSDLKLNREPSRVVLLDLEATRVGERQSLLVRSRASGKTLRLRVHASSSSTFLQWLTALYLARLDGALPSSTSLKPAVRAKRVTFNEEISEWGRRSTRHEDSSDPETETENHQDDDEDGVALCRETVDLGELFYSPGDLAAFRASHAKAMQDGKTPLRAGRKLVRSLVAKLRRKHSSESDEENE